MADKLDRSEQAQLSEALGLDRTPVEVDVKQPQDFGPSQDAIVDQQNIADQKQGPSQWEIAKASWRQDNTMSELLEEPDAFPIDLNFKGTDYLSDENVKARIDALQLSDKLVIAEALGGTTSAEHADSLLRKFEADEKDEALLMDAGASALLTRMGVSILDPVDIGISLAAAPVGGLVKANKLGRIATAALTAASANAGVEAVLAQDSAVRDEHDVLYAAIGGLVLGGALGSLTKAENDQLLRDLDDIAKGDLDGVAARLRGEDSAGAARAKPQSLEADDELAVTARKTTAEILEEAEAPEFRGGIFKATQKLLANLQGRLFYSSSETVRTVASKMFEGGFLRNNSGTRGFTAEGRAQHVRRLFEAGVFRDTMKPFEAWAKRNNKGAAKRIFGTEVGEEFYTDVSMAMRGLDASPEAKQAAAALRPHMDRMFELAQKAGVKGFDKEGLENYFPRMMNGKKFRQLKNDVGVQALEQFYTRALKSGSEDIDDDLAEAIAKAFVRQMRMNTAGMHNDILDGIRLDDIDRVRAMFTDDAGNLSSEAESLINMLEAAKVKENAERGSVGFAKRRIRFDESYAEEVIDRSGNRVPLAFTDPLENDARKVLKRYGMTMSGHIGMATELGVASRAEFDDLKAAIISEAEGGTRNLDEAQAEVRALEDGYKLLMGHSIEDDPNGAFSTLSRTATGYAYLQRGGQFGVNALAEAGNIIGLGSIRSLLRTVPEFAGMIRRGADGSLDGDLANQAELLFAPGVHTLTGVAIRNFDELGQGFEGASLAQRIAAKADPYLKAAGRFTSITSGLAGVTDFTQRLAAIEFMRVLGRAAQRGKISKSLDSRLRAAGLEPEMQQRVLDSLKEAGVFKGKRLTDLDPSKWTDADTLDAFQMATHRIMRDAIQENDVANATTALHKPLGRMVFQFLRFPMEAVNKQLLRGIHHHDVEAAKSFIAAMFIGGTAYVAQTSLDYANNPEELEKRLDPANVARIAFMRTGQSSLLPPVVDNVLDIAGQDPLFAMGRSSGLATSVFNFNNNPSAQLVKDAYNTVGIGPRLLKDDYQFSQQDWRHIEGLLPFQRMYGIKNALHAIEQSLPETSE